MSDLYVNEVTLIGTLGDDPEVRGSNGSKVVKLSLATTETWRDKATSEKRERTEWHTAVLFGRDADYVEKYFRKGMLIYVRGQLRTSKWTNEAGENRYRVEVHVSGYTSKISIMDARGRGVWENQGPDQKAGTPDQNSGAPAQGPSSYNANAIDNGGEVSLANRQQQQFSPPTNLNDPPF